MNNLQKLVAKYVEGVDSKLTMQEGLTIVHSMIEKAKLITETLEKSFKEWGIGEMINCPNCGSHTLLEFVSCHWCGHQVLETVNDTKPATKETPAAKVEKESPAEKEADEVKTTKTAKPAKGTAKVEKVDNSKNVKVQMGNEPAATLNFDGKVDKTTKEIKKFEKELPTENKDAAKKVTEGIRLLKESLTLVESEDSGKEELKRINSLTTKLDIKTFGKVSLFRAAIAEQLKTDIESLEKALEAYTVKEAPATKAGKKDKAAASKAAAKKEAKKAKDEAGEEDLESDEMEEVESKFTKKGDKPAGPKVVDVTDEDFSLDEDEETEKEEEVDLDDGEAVDLSQIDVEDLTEEDFELDEESSDEE